MYTVQIDLSVFEMLKIWNIVRICINNEYKFCKLFT